MYWLIVLCGLLIFISPLVTVRAQEADFARIFINRESSKRPSRPVNVYFNEKKVFELSLGEAYRYNILSEGQLEITIALGAYQKGRDNSRTLTIEKGKSYYFTIGATDNKLTYISDPAEGEKVFKKIDDSSIKTEAESKDNPLPQMSASARIAVIRQRAAAKKEEVKRKAAELEEQIDDYFQELKNSAQLAQEVQAEIQVEIEEGEVVDGVPTYNLRASYSYDIDKESSALNMSLVHYPSGAYLLNQSPAAKAIANAARLTIEKYLFEFLEPGSIIDFVIIGSADGVPITSYYPYGNEFGPLDNFKFYEADNYEVFASTDQLYYQENFASQQIQLAHRDSINLNQTLAFLRSYGIRHYFENNIEALKSAEKRFTHFAKVEESEDAKFRKVTIQILIEDVIKAK